jgi:hypothetical protein
MHSTYLNQIPSLLFVPSKHPSHLKGDTTVITIPNFLTKTFPNSQHNPNTSNTSSSQDKLEQPQIPKQKKYQITTNPTDYISLPPTYSTDDEDEKCVIDLINGKGDIEWEKVKSKDPNLQIYIKFFNKDCTIIVRWHAIIPYSLKTIMEVTFNNKIYLQWNKDTSDKNRALGLTKDGNFEIEDMYIYIPFPFIMGDRDMVLRRKMWKEYNGNNNAVLVQMKSIEHVDYPVKKKPIRAYIYMAGNYYEEIEPGKTRISALNHADVKFNKTLAKLAKNMTWEKQVETYTKLKKACDMYEKGKFDMK